MFVCLRPGRGSRPGWYPVGVRSLVTPFHETRHNPRVRLGSTKRLHSPLAFPHSQGPKRETSIYEEAPSEEPGCTHDLALGKKSLPHEHQKIPHGANAKTRNDASIDHYSRRKRV